MSNVDPSNGPQVKPITIWPMISPTSNALETRVLTAEVYCLWYSCLRRTFVIVLLPSIMYSAALTWCLHQIILVAITDQCKAGAELSHSTISKPSTLRLYREVTPSSVQHTIVKKSDNDCLFDETSLDGAAGSSGTTTVPGAPGTFSVLPRSSSLMGSPSDSMMM